MKPRYADLPGRQTKCSRAFRFLLPLILFMLLWTRFPSSSFRSSFPAILSSHVNRAFKSNPSMHLSSIRSYKFLEVPQIIWGLNNQKIAMARASLTARYLNRTLIMPVLSESVFHNTTHPAAPLPFDRIFSLEAFNSLCEGYVAMARRSDIPQNMSAVVVSKGSGRRWTIARDMAQLEDCKKQEIDTYDYLKLEGKHPFLWHDHWPVKDYANVFRCLVLNKALMSDVAIIQSKLSQISAGIDVDARTGAENSENSPLTLSSNLHYVAVHMRIEIDWMIHCKNTEKAFLRKGKVVSICSSKQQIMDRVSRVSNHRKPSLVYLAVADELLNDSSLMDGWSKDLVPYEKRRLGVLQIYNKHHYTIQAALDYEICRQSSVFIGNSYSTFSSLVVLERTLANEEAGNSDLCPNTLRSYAYNLAGKDGGPRLWVSKLSDSSLEAISYGSEPDDCML